MIFLHSHGVGTSRACAFTRPTATMPVQIIVENPYRLAKDIRGIGFKTADAIAMKLGIEKTAMIRVRAGISYALSEALNDGHCGLPEHELHSLAEKLLEVPVPLIETAIGLELGEQSIVRDSVRSDGVHISQRPVPGREGDCGAHIAVGGRKAHLAADRRRKSDCVFWLATRNRISRSPKVKSRRSNSHFPRKCSSSPAGRVSARPPL